MRPAFRYPDEDWPAIDACLMLAGRRSPTHPVADAHVCSYRLHTLTANAHVHAYYRRTLENIVHEFRWLTERADPRSPEVIATTSLMAKIAEHSLAANAAATELEALPTQPFRSIGYAIAAKPETLFDWVRGELLEPSADDYTPHADYLDWKAKNAAVARWATTAARGSPKSVRYERDTSGRILTKVRHGRSRGNLVDNLLRDLLTFWVARGGEVGTRINSPSTRFVVAAAGQVLSETVPDVKMPGAIVDFVRDQRCV